MAIILDIVKLGDLIVERLASANAGSQLRATLKELSGAASSDMQIIHAAEMEHKRPPRPYIAFREGPVVAVDQIEVLPTMRWWIYDDTDKLYRRINTLIPLIGRAYAAKPRLQFVANGIIGNVAANLASGASYDSSLDLNYRYVTISILAG